MKRVCYGFLDGGLAILQPARHFHTLYSADEEHFTLKSCLGSAGKKMIAAGLSPIVVMTDGQVTADVVLSRASPDLLTRAVQTRR